MLFRKLIIYICKVNQKENNIMPPPIKEFDYYLKSKNKQDIISLCSDLIKMEFIFSYHGKQSFFYSIVLLEFSEIYESKLIDLAERFNCNLTKMERFNIVPLLSRNRKQDALKPAVMRSIVDEKIKEIMDMEKYHNVLEKEALDINKITDIIDNIKE